MTTKARYDIYFNTPATGVIHAADCVVVEVNGQPQRIGFRYRDTYLNHPNAFSIDPAQLPLSARETQFNCTTALPAFIDDYLPDAWGRKVLTRLAFYRDKKRFNANSVIDSLALLGDSRIGALSIVPAQRQPVYSLGHSLTTLAQAEQIAQQIDEERLDNVDSNELNLIYLASAGSGVGGARPKALLHDAKGYYLAKFNCIHQDPYNNARVELACLNMARAVGLEVGYGRVENGINGREVLLLNRFDIAEGSKNDKAGIETAVPRQHLITINGLLKDTATQRDPGNAFRYDDICQILRRHSCAIEADLEQLLRLMLFNRAIHNTDDHERNFSLINRGDGYRFAPAYDMVPSLVLGEYHAAGFGYQANPPKPQAIMQMGKVFGLSSVRVAQIAEQVIDVCARWRDFAEQVALSEEDCDRMASGPFAK